MDEVWEKAIKTALDGETDCESVKNLTLDGAVKCFQVRFPPPCLLQKFCNLEHLSIANAGVSSLENFPNLPRLQKLVLSDNRIAGGLEYLVKAGLRDLDLSNNRIQFINDLVPLGESKIMSLDLYECPVTKVVNYRGEVFGLVRSVMFLDEMDVNENERLESDEDDDEEEEEEEAGRLSKMRNWGNVVDIDEDGEESDEVEDIDEEDEDDDDSDEDDELEEVDDEEDVELVSTGRLSSAEGEIDGHDNGEEDDNKEIGEEEDGGCGDDDIEDEDGTEFLVRPARQHEDVAGSDFDAGEDDDYSGEEEDGVFNVERHSQPSVFSPLKRKRDEDGAVEEDDNEDDEGIENGHLQTQLSTSAQLKKKINGAVDKEVRRHG